MKILYHIFDMDKLENMHLDANVKYSMLDVMLECRNSIDNMTKSHLLGSVVMPKNVRGIIDIMKMDKKTYLEEMMKMYNLSVEHPNDGLTVLELYISPDYFALGDLLKQQFGRLGRKIVKVVDQQTIIDKLEEDLNNVYKKKFSGKVIEGDGKNLRCHL